MSVITVLERRAILNRLFGTEATLTGSMWVKGRHTQQTETVFIEAVLALVPRARLPGMASWEASIWSVSSPQKDGSCSPLRIRCFRYDDGLVTIDLHAVAKFLYPTRKDIDIHHMISREGVSWQVMCRCAGFQWEEVFIPTTESLRRKRRRDGQDADVKLVNLARDVPTVTIRGLWAICIARQVFGHEGKSIGASFLDQIDEYFLKDGFVSRGHILDMASPADGLCDEGLPLPLAREARSRNSQIETTNIEILVVRAIARKHHYPKECLVTGNRWRKNQLMSNQHFPRNQTTKSK